MPEEATDDDSLDLCHLYQMAQSLGLEQCKDELRAALADNWEDVIVQPSFYPEHISKYELLSFLVGPEMLDALRKFVDAEMEASGIAHKHYDTMCSVLCHFNSLIILLYWLDDASVEFCREIKRFTEQKWNCSWIEFLHLYNALDEGDLGVSIDKFFTASMSYDDGTCTVHD